MTDENEKSSEVMDKEIAQEALDATGETSPAAEPEPQTVPVAKHAALRQRAQTAEVAAARAEGMLSALQSSQEHQVPAQKSPIERAAEAQGVDIDDVELTGKLYREQQAFDRQVANQEAEKVANQQVATRQMASINTAKVAHPDWQDVVTAGQSLLTDGEYLDLTKAGDNYGDLVYAKCQTALERNKPSPATTIAPEKKPSESEAKAEAERVPTQSEILKNLNVDPTTEAALLL